MAKPSLFPRKQRTRQHVIADLSVNFVERFILEEGHTAQRLATDYGYDVFMVTYDEEGYAEPDLVYLQLKASDNLIVQGNECVFDLDIRDYNLWTRERMPVILVLFDALRQKGYWIFIQDYFEPISRQPSKRSKTIRIRVPLQQKISRRAIAAIRTIKREFMKASWGE